MGFLSATQEGQTAPRLGQWLLGFPERGPFFYIWDWICEIGLGAVISWQEIRAWSEISGIKPTRQESIFIVQLSSAWLNERHRGHGKHELPCWAGE